MRQPGFVLAEVASQTWRAYWRPMATTSQHPRPRPSSSPFLPHREPTVEEYELDDRVSHDSYGLGRVVGVDGGGATVDFTSRTVRIPTPFRKMTKL